ncbi:ATP-binding protein [Catenuloplanes indicus]|uniref:SpoVK/Ycf46/Vps4 family AAA+-type ATPase n=1 Tax=Catenuloplanes indicus TaxID=137267 RepID=A0AAE3W5E8_9ACTN|nr:ATP-binding protein [Catenuloplanes indicus]MDQ0370193.1 SpoVK/Ycf46/Vps4 family AAA+-type ATPase [Catenuloplanes indicus]
MSEALIDSMRAAVDARPDDVHLRLHLAELLLAAGRQGDAVAEAAQALQRDPVSEAAQALMRRALTPGPPAPSVPAAAAAPAPGPANPPAQDASPAQEDPLAAYEEELAGIAPPRFADDGEPEPVRSEADRVFDVERVTARLADVGGMQDVKKRLEMAFLGPMRNTKLRKLFGKSLRGGMLLYGPPGCGKTFLARALAGELGASFISLAVSDVLEMWIGSSERNLHELFEAARRNAPCVLFLDEIDALGHKRSSMGSSAMRTVGNQLLAELDGVDSVNEGVFVLGATNAPWDVDAALRRPGRLDRTVFVAPPDAPAREAILRYHLRDRPIAAVRLDPLVRGTADLSGADLAHLCETAAEYALHDSLTSGDVRMIEQRDLEAAMAETKPSIGPWLATARNAALYANESGIYDELAAYLKKRKML